MTGGGWREKGDRTGWNQGPESKTAKLSLTLVPLQDPVRPGDTGAAPTSATVGWGLRCDPQGNLRKALRGGPAGRLFLVLPRYNFSPAPRGAPALSPSAAAAQSWPKDRASSRTRSASSADSGSVGTLAARGLLLLSVCHVFHHVYNLYTLAPWEVRHLIQHHRLIGRDFEEVMRGRNETLDVYPNRPAPVVIEQDGQRIVRQDILSWGFPPFKGRCRLRDQLPKPEEPSMARMARTVSIAASFPASAFAEPDRNTSEAGGVALVRARPTSSPFSFLPGSGGRGLAIEATQESAQHRRPLAVLDHDHGAQRNRRADP